MAVQSLREKGPSVVRLGATQHLHHRTGSLSGFQAHQKVFGSEFIFPCRFVQGEIHWSEPTKVISLGWIFKF